IERSSEAMAGQRSRGTGATIPQPWRSRRVRSGFASCTGSAASGRSVTFESVSHASAMHGYSDRINHALAFAAKHLDQQVRKGTRLPYLTTPANVGMILCRYGRDDETVVAGILRDVVEDC